MQAGKNRWFYGCLIMYEIDFNLRLDGQTLSSAALLLFSVWRLNYPIFTLLYGDTTDVDVRIRTSSCLQINQPVTTTDTRDLFPLLSFAFVNCQVEPSTRVGFEMRLHGNSGLVQSLLRLLLQFSSLVGLSLSEERMEMLKFTATSIHPSDADISLKTQHHREPPP